MAEKFKFDDEDKDRIKIVDEPSHIDKLESIKENPIADEFSMDEESEDFGGEDNYSMSKKKKKFIWKWWHYVLIGLGVLFIAFMIYIFALSDNDGPVFGNRCEGMVEINKDLISSAVDTSKQKHSEISKLDIEIQCRQLKVDIDFKEGMDTKKAQEIAEEAVLTLDGLVGKRKEEGKKYSTLFGKINNVSQYEVNLYLTSSNSADFPIYGTKHTQNDVFSYTLASVKDETSKAAAQETKKK